MDGPIVVGSRIRDVAVFRSGAVVTRVAAIADSGWPEEVAVSGLPLSLEDGSVRVRLQSDDARVGLPQPSDVRVEWFVPPLGEPVEAPSEVELRRAATEVQRLEARLAGVAEEIANLDRLTLGLPERIEREAPRAPAAAAFFGVCGWVERARLARASLEAELRVKLRDAQEAKARLERRVAEARAERGVDEQRVCKRVVVRLRGGGQPGLARLVLEYRVPGACWRPSYVVRVARDGKKARIAVRALVAQQSGEPWEDVALTLSTADLQRRIELPVLKSQRIGRRQTEAAPRAWRDPPTGAETLFESLDAALAARLGALAPPKPQPAVIAPPEPEPEPEMDADELDAPMLECAAPCDDRMPLPPPGAPMPSAAPMAPPRMANMTRAGSVAPQAKVSRPAARRREMAPEMAKEESKKVAFGRKADLGGGLPAAELALDGAEGGEGGGGGEELRGGFALEYHLLRVVAWDGPHHERGTLKPVTRRDLLPGLSASQFSRADQLAREADRRSRQPVSFPVTTTAVESSAGSFDYAFRAGGPVDVPNDGRVHNVPLFSREAAVETTLVVVPKESDQAVRVAKLQNPLGAPILAGPAEIYLEDEFLVSSKFDTQPAGATIDLGLGVEPALKVARNTHFKETAGGLLGGSLALQHTVELEVASRLAAPTRVEVRERVPLYRNHQEDKDIVVETGEVTPAWEPFDQGPHALIQGGKRWRFTLEPGKTQKLSYSYTVKIDGKNELVGGNRRD